MPITVKRTGSDAVEISADDSVYYDVQFSPKKEIWGVTRHYHGVISAGDEIGTYQTAEEAVSSVKSMLSERESELSRALEQLN